jgi:uncharacterized protein YraI
MTRRVLLAIAFCGGFAGAARADPAITTAPAAMRAAPSAKSRVVQQIPANARIDVMQCARFWCRASWRDRSGFVPSGAVSPVAAEAYVGFPFSLDTTAPFDPASVSGGYDGYHGHYHGQSRMH